MKGLLAVSIGLVAVIVACPVMAQNYAGIFGGLNIANIEVDAPDQDFDYVTKYGFGAVLGVKLFRNLTLHLEPMYLQNEAEAQDFDRALGTFVTRFKTTTLTIPAFVKLDIGSSGLQPYLLAGPCVSFTLNSELALDTPDFDLTGDAGEMTKSIDFAVGFGGGLSYAIGSSSIFLEGRYLQGLTNVNEGGVVQVSGAGFNLNLEVGDDEVTTRGFQLMTGVTLPLGI